jgi:hypothetical protein
LKCLATKYNISVKKEFTFKDLWNEIIKKTDLPLKSQLFNLHEERNLVQHAGIIPSYEDVIAFKKYVEDFLKEVIEREFKISFDEVSLAWLIENGELRKVIQKAEKFFENEKYKECIKSCDDALIKATFNIADVFGKAGMLTGYFGAQEELKKVINKNYAEKYKEKEFYTLAKDLSEAILQVAQASTGMQFLDEYRNDFLQFRYIVENIKIIPYKQMRDYAWFSLDFVTKLILKWQNEGIIKERSYSTEKKYTYEEIRKKYPKAYEKWGNSADTKLIKLYLEGKTIKELSEIFQRQPGAIRSRLKKLGLLKSD